MTGGLERPGVREPAHVWLLRVSSYKAESDGLDVLDAAERRRHQAFVRAEDRDRYAVAHVGLRRLLGAYTDTAPGEMVFVRESCPLCAGPHGRPAVSGGAPHFSLSHSGDLVLIAVAANPVGADVEEIPALSVADDVARTLHPLEQAELAALAPADRVLAFSRCWTRKEAYLKGTGEGLAGGPERMYVGTGPEPAAVAGWALADIPVDDGYGAAIATASTPR
ncbi:4'-phosphopantetheinyl transferase family protein [Streptomyces silvisoli]|uniref:4'-phosphopantetheinyl transferase superfamily protein n=1 Tax=Streptomyces silvisoli TaxID=3034235 RepID=A0ABT5ZU27_9ACTN|nr:4'-phosphopantetheinyl transferase superfamily protein [Streptomyces silvisoli]MDF3292523.1 4'-phosphopantetheinyl transferase superfamily protein [Streptomyces silvisoli]